MGEVSLIRIGRRVFNARYLIWTEHNDGTCDAAFEQGRVFRLEGEDADLWRRAIDRLMEEPRQGERAFAHGRPAPPPEPEGRQTG